MILHCSALQKEEERTAGSLTANPRISCKVGLQAALSWFLFGSTWSRDAASKSCPGEKASALSSARLLTQSTSTWRAETLATRKPGYRCALLNV